MSANAQQVELPASQAEGAGAINHSTLVTWVNESDTATFANRTQSERARDYYDSNQLTEKEIADLKARSQAPVVINRVKPKMDALMGMEKAAKTTAKAFPRTPRHEKDAEAATESIRFVLQDNQFDQTRSHAWESILIEGTGACDITVVPMKAKPGSQTTDFKVTIKPMMWDRLIWDPHSRRKDFSDARFLGQVVWMDYDEARAKYPEADAILDTMIAGSDTYADKPRWMDNTRRRVKIVEMYYRKPDGEMWYACFTYGGYCEAPKKSPYVDEEGNTEWCYEFASAFVDREGGRYGAVLQLMDVQDEINKRRSKALHLMSVRQVAVFKGAVDDVNVLRQELAKPDGVVELNAPLNESFEVMKTGDMAAAQFNLLTEAKMEIDQVGANAAVQGKDKTVQSGVALQRRQQAGQTEVGPMFDVLRYWQLRVFRKVWNRIKQYWKEERWIRVTDDETNVRWVGVNRKMTKGDMALEQAKQQGAPPEVLAQLQQQIAMDPAMQEMTMQNSVADLDVDIIISEVPDVLTAQIEDFQVLGEMVKSGFQMPPEAVILASPLSNKEQILKMMRDKPQLPPEVQKQMEAMQEEGKRLQEENQALKQDKQGEQATLALKQQEAEAELALQKAKQDGEAMLARQKAEADFALKKYIAEQELALAQLQCDNDMKMGEQKMSMEREMGEKKLGLEKESRDAELAVTPEFEAVSKADAKLDAITEGLGAMVGLLQQGLAMQQQMLDALNRPKQVAIGSVRKVNGQIAGATVTVN